MPGKTARHPLLERLAGSWQSIFCDLSVLFFSIFLADSIRPMLEKELLDPAKPVDQYSSSVGGLYIATVVAQVAGMWLLRPVIRKQMHSPRAPAYGSGSFFGAILLLTMHFGLFGVILTWDGFRSLWGNTDGFKKILPILLCGLPTITAVIISFPGKKEKPFTPLHNWMGWIGTLLVTFSVVVVSLSCWHVMLDGMGKDLHGKSIGGNIIIMLLFGFVFLLMYLPQRYAFLITDYNRVDTWLRILLVYSPFAWQVMVGR
jgi:hypothetical protein